MDELSVGDALIITHPITLLEETKIVRMVLSNISIVTFVLSLLYGCIFNNGVYIGISSAFSTDLITTTAFKYIKAPKETEGSRAIRIILSTCVFGSMITRS